MTMREFTHKHLSDLAVAFLGDGRNNVARSLAVGAAKVGVDMRIAAPKSFWPEEAFIRHVNDIGAKTGGSLTITKDVGAAIDGVDFIYTDVWLSMGEDEAAWPDRIKKLAPYRVTGRVMAETGNAFTKFMHCLPAFHDTGTEVGSDIAKRFGIDCMEVTDEVFESPASIVFDQAENRMHTIKAVLVATIAG
jgi:ornithine carbamoyltransferase